MLLTISKLCKACDISFALLSWYDVIAWYDVAEDSTDDFVFYIAIRTFLLFRISNNDRLSSLLLDSVVFFNAQRISQRYDDYAFMS